MKKVLLFGDPGIDDSLAIIYGLLNPKIEIVGIVTSYGNVTKEQTTRNALYLLQLAGRQDIPVISGATLPFFNGFTTYYPEIHGAEGLGPIRPPESVTTIPVHDFSLIPKIIERYKGELTIIDVGRSTSLAMVLNIWKELMQSVKEVYIMSGVFLQPGNVTSVAEANAYGDPVSTQFVINQSKNLTMIPLNVTNSAVLLPNEVNYIVEHTNGPFKSLIKPIYDYYYSAYKKLNKSIKGAPLHDVVAISAIANPSFFQYMYRKVEVDLKSFRGQTVADFRSGAEATGVRIGLKLNQKYFINDFIETMVGKQRY
ncbi:nucleoside hydrolase [Bacillus mycoides]|uniref:Nucleoside hydrolase n=1 Tax=Bacillus thuringiensis serovar navarrensis TaxID=339658 RepID=A0A243AGG5_BACTU|nr:MULTISPECIES: nucleoside hydrolase [Bacillus]MDI6534441.1 nucleoside hydrolase [Bacillus mycoides]MED1270127.1 nucleoside hydrolase [Bacillus mycoides]OTY19621.1 nucleoside hydrolase [Bacillus thuringiensis serovar navarrensis]PRD06968.1 nucleoside hydrolase [Bacillus sp. MYb56]